MAPRRDGGYGDKEGRPGQCCLNGKTIFRHPGDPSTPPLLPRKSPTIVISSALKLKVFFFLKILLEAFLRRNTRRNHTQTCHPNCLRGLKTQDGVHGDQLCCRKVNISGGHEGARVRLIWLNCASQLWLHGRRATDQVS